MDSQDSAPDRQTAKSERIGLRTTADLKATLERAADLEGESLSSFVLTAALREARHVLATQETLILRGKDRDRFFELLDNPPPAPETLRDALREYRRRVSHDDA